MPRIGWVIWNHAKPEAWDQSRTVVSGPAQHAERHADVWIARRRAGLLVGASWGGLASRPGPCDFERPDVMASRRARVSRVCRRLGPSGRREQPGAAQATSSPRQHPGHRPEREHRGHIRHELDRRFEVAAQRIDLGRHVLTGRMPARGQFEVGHRAAGDDPPALRPPEQRGYKLPASFIRDALKPARRICPKIRSMVSSLISRSRRRPISGENHLPCTLR